MSVITKFFFYNDLMDITKLEYICRGHLNVIKQVPAILDDTRLYRMRITPVAIKESNHRINTPSKIIYGSLTYAICDEVALKCIDGYIGCSYQFINKNHINDLFYRVKDNVRPFEFNSLDDFFKFKYKIHEPEEAYVYYGNKEFKSIKTMIKERKNRGGFFYKDFLTVFNNVIDITNFKW